MTDTDILQQTLKVARRRWRSAAALCAVSRGAAIAAFLLAAAAFIDRWASPADLSLVVLIVLAIAAASVALVYQLWPLHRRPADRQVARLLEERCPELEDRIASAEELVRGSASGPFRDLVIADAARQTQGLDIQRIVSRTAMRSAAGRAGIAVASLTIAVALVGAPSYRAFQSLLFYVVPERVSIQVTPGNQTLEAGRPLRITAQLTGGSRTAAAALSLGNGTTWRTVPMQPEGDLFVTDFESVTSGFSYRVGAGKATSQDYTVAIVYPPRIERIDVEYTYPKYTGLEPRLEEDGGDIYAPAGTAVRLQVHASKPIATATMVMVDGTKVSLREGAAAVLETSFRLTQDGSYRIALVDPDGLTNPGETEYFIRTMNDRPPDVRILRPAGDRKVTPLEEVAIEARADDDYGLERFDLVYSVRGGAEQVVPFAHPPRGTTVEASRTLYMEDLKVQPGDFVTYYARARDIGRGKRSAEARSDIFFLEIKPFGEEFTAAESLAAMGGAAGEQGLEALIEAQKEIIIATWKLDRRASAGRSEQDLETLARAQEELKARTAGIAQPRAAGARPMFRAGQRSPAQAGSDVLMKAVEAMGRAERMLDQSKTSDALPHEMEALNQLLKAAAEVRRRQVSRRQANAGSGGSGRAGQDLSSLFDRELQRQQETNYETPSTPAGGEGQQNAENEALARVRELARRQDELNQEQRELAERQASMTPEEIKRQLERLTREQSELRRQAEELSRQMAQQASESTNGKKGQGQGSSAMRDVSEEMRSAASELRREAPDQASARSGRALERLRQLERELHGGSDPGRQRAASELQLEAQQLAESQQRVADEAKRLEQTKGNGETERQLADQKDGLARRADRLEADVKRLAEGGPKDNTPLQEASRELERQQVGRRMREGATALRQEGTKPGSGNRRALTESEHQLARDLSQIAEKLGAATGGDQGESRKLSDELARARQVRDRLTELEEKMAEAARRAGGARSQADQARQAEQGGQRQQGQQNQRGKQGGQGSPGDQGQQGSPGDQGKEGEQGKQGEKGKEGQQGQGGESSAEAELSKLRSEYDRELKAAEQLLKRLGGGPDGMGGSPEQHEYSKAALGTEAFKQDFSQWDELRRNVDSALEQYEASLTQKLLERETRDRLKAGGDETMPDEYRKLVAKYYESLAKKKP